MATATAGANGRKTAVSEETIKRGIATIRAAEKAIGDGKLSIIRGRITIGQVLAGLHDGTEHGQWAKVLAELGYDQRKAARLMKIATSALAEVIGRIPPDSVDRLPIDLETLDRLCGQSEQQLTELLTRNLDNLDVAEIAALLDELAPKAKPPRKRKTAPTSPPVANAVAHDVDDKDELVDDDEEDEESSDESDNRDDEGEEDEDRDQATDEEGCDGRAEDDRFDDVHLDYSERHFYFTVFRNLVRDLTENFEESDREIVVAIRNGDDTERTELHSTVRRALAILQRADAALDDADKLRLQRLHPVAAATGRGDHKRPPVKKGVLRGKS